MAFITVNFFSNVLGRGASCSVILPQKSTRLIGMDSAEASDSVPVLWLLHGMSDDCTIWSRRTSIERYVASSGLAVIMPDVEISGYANMAHGGRFYDYIAKELPEIMGGFFNISDKREDNFIAGLSMGGAGCMKIGLANPDKYAAIGCLSAGALNYPFPEDTKNIDREKYEYTYRLYDGKALEGTEEDVFGNAQKIADNGLPAPRIYHAIGKDDFLLKSAHHTRDYFQSLEGNPFDYTYVEDEGSHTWEYWDKHIVEFLKFIRK